MGILGHFLYRPDFGAKGQKEYLAFDEGLVSADAEIYAAQLHRLATSNVHGLVFTGPGADGGLDADKLDGLHASAFELTGAVAAHSALATGIHGVGAGTVAKVSDIAVDANLSVAAQDAITKRHSQGTDTALGTVGVKNPPIDADKAIYRDSTASDTLVTSTWTQIKTFLKTYWDTLYEAIGAVATHAGLTTGIHGVGGSTVASVANIATHAALAASVHGVSASGFEDKANKGAVSGYASLDASSLVVQNPANATATPTQNKIPIADGVGGILALGWIPATLTGKDADTVDGQHRVLTINADHTHQATGAQGGQLNHALALTNLSYDLAGHTGFEPTVTKGNLTAGSTKITIGGTGTGALIGAGASVDVAEANLTHNNIGGLTIGDPHSQYAFLAGRAGGQTLIGGTGVTDILKLQGTSGDGTLTSPAIQLLVGNAGVTTAITVLNNGNVGIGTTPKAKLDVADQIKYGISQTVSDASSITFSGLDGDVDKIYKIIMIGRFATAAANRNVRLGPNGGFGTAGFRNVCFRYWESNGSTDYNISVRNYGGLTMGFTDWGADGDILIEGTLYAATGRARVYHGTHTYYNSAAGADRELAGDHSGWWSDTTTTITSLSIDFNGGTFTGSVILRTIAW